MIIQREFFELLAMNTQKTAALLAVYGSILFVLGILYLVADGFNFKIEFLLSVLIGVISSGVSYFVLHRHGWAFWAGMIIPGAMIPVMGWLSLEAFYKLIDMIQNDPVGSPYNYAVFFFILLTAYLLSIMVFAIQVMLARSNARELKA